jgi:predicted lipoprotein with Yx(FWY)xxD motif
VKVTFNKTLKRSILVDARGITLYAFTYDDEGKPACYVDSGYRCVPAWPSCVDDPEYHCVKEWPALTTTGTPRAGAGVNRKLLGVARRKDGRLQVTYNRHPLYFYAGGLGPPADKKPGALNGQGFAGIWWVVSPAGAEIK